jgi:predicted HTH transcriptional regulator
MAKIHLFLSSHQKEFANERKALKDNIEGDRLEIWNPGHLPPNLTLDDLLHEHSSIPANPLIAEPLFLAKYIEKVGSGTIDMIRLCKEAKLKPLSFKIQSGSFVLTIKRNTIRVNEGVNEGVKSLFEVIKNNPNNRSTFFAKELNTSVKNIERWLKQLKDEGKIIFRGASKTGGYYVN